MFYPLKTLNKKFEITRYKAWLKQAQYDLDASKMSQKHNYFEWACYQATQSAEKILKSLIVYSGWRPPRTHKLAVLIGIGNSVNKEFRNIKFTFRDLEVYTYISRYPFLIPGEDSAPHDFVNLEDSEKCIHEAENIITTVQLCFDGKANAVFEDVEEITNIDLNKRLEYVKTRIVECMDPQEIILFGGYAKGKDSLSTLDILVIANTTLPFIDRIKAIRECTKGGQPVVSPLVYTPEEFNLMLAGGEGFLEEAIDEGKVLYSKNITK